MKQSIATLLARYSREFSDFDGIKLEHPNQKGYGDDVPLHIAARHGLLDDISTLIASGALIDMPGDVGFTALHYAAMGGQVDAALLLIRLGANKRLLNELDQSPAEVASLGGHEDLARILK